MTITPESVQELLSSESFSDRVRGLNHLKFIDPKLAFEMVKPLVNDRNARIRYAAVSQLDPLGLENPDEALGLLRDRLFNDPEIDVKSIAADVIGGLKLTAAYADLRQVYETTDEWLLQMSIIATIGEMGDPQALELLKIALDSENSLIRMAAISALGDLQEPQAIPLLLPLVNDEDWQVRFRLAIALGQFQQAEVQAALEQLAQDEFEQVATIAQDLLKMD
ncbi:MAG: HEAT repeat domain-containing protein [Snowella sp.]|nr:HEAT repeat domain-containing protein [Snowella sp.]